MKFTLLFASLLINFFIERIFGRHFRLDKHLDDYDDIMNNRFNFYYENDSERFFEKQHLETPQSLTWEQRLFKSLLMTEVLECCSSVDALKTKIAGRKGLNKGVFKYISDFQKSEKKFKSRNPTLQRIKYFKSFDSEQFLNLIIEICILGR